MCKKTFFKIMASIALIFTTHFHSFSANLVVGFFPTNQTITLNGNTAVYDTVFVVNSGTLNIINGSNITIQNVLAVANTATLNVSGSRLTLNCPALFLNNSVVSIQDTLTLGGDLFLLDNTDVEINNAVVSIPMTYKGQFKYTGRGQSSFKVNHSTLDLGAGAINGDFSDSASFLQQSSTWQTTLGIAMTASFAKSATVNMDSLNGGMELIAFDSSSVTVTNSDNGLKIIWHSFNDTADVNFSFPPANSVSLPGVASDVVSYQFSDALPNVNGVDYVVDVQNSKNVLWATISNPGSEVVINNSYLIAAGFFYFGNTADTVKNITNNLLYTNDTAALSDRTFALVNSTVQAWNFYPTTTAKLFIDSAVYGETISFNDTELEIRNSVCDGTGGYFGAENNSRVNVYNSTLKRVGGSLQIIINMHDARMEFQHCRIAGDAVVNDNSTMFYCNTVYDSLPVVNQNGYFVNAWLDSIGNITAGTTQALSGKLWDINGSLNSDNITRYILSYQHVDSANAITLKDTSGIFNIAAGNFGNWNTQGLAAGNYEIKLKSYAGTDSVVCTRTITINSSSSIPENITPSITVFPNPNNGVFIINNPDDNSGTLAVEIFDVSGRLIKTQALVKGMQQVQLDNITAGLYFLSISNSEGIILKKTLMVFE